MLYEPTRRTVFAIWLGWVIVLLVFFAIVPARFSVERPDYAQFWTEESTRVGGAQDNKHFLQDPFLAAHVAWDSEYYLAIALEGYEAPEVERIGDYIMGAGGLSYWPFVMQRGSAELREGLSLSYAFFPFYPLLMRVLSWPLSVLGLTSIATATLAGMIISLLGTLAAAVAMFEIGRDEMDENGGLRAAFYLLVFPASFFMAVVYTEGLFLGLAFSCLVLARRGYLVWASLLAVLATFTRGAGVVLVVPLMFAWIRDGDWLGLDIEWRQVYFRGLPWQAIGRALLVFAPAIAFLMWRVSIYGMAFSQVEADFFGRSLLALGSTFFAWREAIGSIFGNNSQAVVYFAIEIGGTILGLSACIWGLKKFPDLAWFGLMVILLPALSGPIQGNYRYAMAAPPVFLMLSYFGRKPTFDRIWTLASILLMGMMATLFIFDMWAG
jgi:hypothetical protein